MNQIDWKKIAGIAAAVAGTAFAAASIAAKAKKGDSVYRNQPEQKNPMEGKKVVFVEDENDKETADGKKGHLEAVGEAVHTPSFYEMYIKRGCDVVLSFDMKEGKVLTPAAAIGSKVPGKIGRLVNKAFGNSCYAHDVSVYPDIDYQRVSLKKSVELTEGENVEKSSKPKALILASVASMIDQFNMQNIQLLLDNGYEVDVACNFYVGNNCSDEKVSQLLQILKVKGVNAFQVDFARNVFNAPADLKSLNQVESIVKGKAESINEARFVDKIPYTLLHSHSPIGGIVGRLVANKYGIYSIYTAHGFHFYKGASRKNWMMFYPVEKEFSKITDVLITINDEDYQLAKKNFKAKKICRIPGIGVDINKFILADFDVQSYKEQLGLKSSDYMILSVGELNDNKNQKLVIRAVANMHDPSVHYFIAGLGKNTEDCRQMAIELGIADQIHILGFRTDIAELNYCADVFAFPSIREGLGMASLEALACGTPVCGMDTRGINEYVVDGETGYKFNNDVESCKKALEKARGKKTELAENCMRMAKKYSCQETNRIMQQIYSEVK